MDERLAAIGAIESATTATDWPLGGGRSIQLAIDGRTKPGERQPIVTLLSVGAKYFDTLGIHVTRGRAFTDADWAPGAAHAIVNQRLADMFFKGEDPLDRTIRLSDEVPRTSTAKRLPPLTIVGVTTPNVIQRDVDGHFSEPDPVVYIPHAANAQQNAGVTLLIRTRGDPAPRRRCCARRCGRSTPTCRSSTSGRWRRISRDSGGRFACSARCSLPLLSSHWSCRPWVCTPSPRMA